MKKDQSEVLPTTQKGFLNLSTTQQIIQLVITIASVVVIIASLWIASQLSPLVQDIALVKQAAADQDRRIEDMKSDITQIKINTDLTKNDVSEIKGILQGSRPQSATTKSPAPQVVYVQQPEVVVVPHPEATPQPTPEPTPPGKEKKPGFVENLLDKAL